MPAISAHPARRSRRLLAGVFVAFAVLVGAHAGEFWPFSIFQMFSSAGQPWTRAIVRDVSTDPTARFSLQASPPAVGLDGLPGEPVPLRALGINQSDLSQFIARTEQWDAERLAGLRALFAPAGRERTLMVYRVQGRLGAADVRVEATPLLLLAPDTTAAFPAPADA